MKQAIRFLLIAISLMPLHGYAQLNPGGILANFGVDADTRANWVKYGPVTGAIVSDDWFAPSGAGNNVIDTSNWATYMAALQAGSNISFIKRMSQLLYAKIGGTLWIDGVYARDYSAASSLKDSTTFTSAAKNGDDPNIWTGGVSNFPNKNDLVDVYAHMRRAGVTVHDSLWLFTGVSTYGTMGSSYYDVELYKNTFRYNATTGTFQSGGFSGGHTVWQFDAAGNIVQTGDLIIAVSYSPGSVPVVDVRIWVAAGTLASITPKYFNFTGAFNGASASPTYGYASIVSKAGTTSWGAGISNFSATAANDTTYATPWGTGTSVGASQWTNQYASQQLIEVGLNLTRMGLDPALYAALSPCQSLFSDIFFKSRASTSFTSAMHDFVTPLTFTRSPVMDFSLQPDTIRCNHNPATITLTNNSTVGTYTWQTLSGNIAGSNSDSSQLSITKPGTYIVSASPAAGCPPTKVDTVVIPIDTFPPIASAFSGFVGNQIALYGGNTVASNYPTPFGGSDGLTFAWTGPDGFTSTIQNPLTDTVWGAYHITVTEKRNGCTDTASTLVDRSMFTSLLVNDLVLSGNYSNGAVALHWQDPNSTAIQTYTVERLDANNSFQPIGTVFTGANNGSFSYVDAYPAPGNNSYRIKATAHDGSVYYSPVITVAADASGLQNVALAGDYQSGMRLMINTGAAARATVVIYDITGQTLQKREVYLSQGSNTIQLPATAYQGRSVQVIALYINDRIAFSQKALF